MDLQYIREFSALSQSSSFRSAARRLFISQPTLSKHISVLESEVGCELVERNPAGVRLTSAGRFFLDSSIELLEYVDDRLDSICAQARMVDSDMAELLIPDFSRVIPQYAEYLLQAKAAFEKEHHPTKLEFNSVYLFDATSFDQTRTLESTLCIEGGGGRLDDLHRQPL